MLSGGNFHAEPVAFAADILALAIAEIGAISERRIALLIDSGLSGLPPFLVQDGGVNSGFMIAQVTAAALASENKSLAHPASVDSLPTSANQEDHVSMATFAGAPPAPNGGQHRAIVVGIEAMAAAQGIELMRGRSRRRRVEAEFAAIRERVAFIDQDRFFAPTSKPCALGTPDNGPTPCVHPAQPRLNHDQCRIERTLRHERTRQIRRRADRRPAP